MRHSTRCKSRNLASKSAERGNGNGENFHLLARLGRGPRENRTTEASLLFVPQLTQHESLVALFDNRTWCREGVAEEFDYISHHHHAWKHPQVNVFITLILFVVMKVGFGPTAELWENL